MEVEVDTMKVEDVFSCIVAEPGRTSILLRVLFVSAEWIKPASAIVCELLVQKGKRGR